MAVLTDDNPAFRPNEYRRAICGCEVIFRYPLVKIIDYRDRLAELEASPHPFAIIVRAYLKALEVAGNVKERYAWKKRFLLELYQRGMNHETRLAIFKFIDWIMALPEEMDAELQKETEIFEETTTMPYMTTPERIGMKRGIAQGIAAILEIKFGEAGQPLSERTNKLIYKIKPPETFAKLMEQLKYARSLAEAEKLFDEVESQYQEVIV